jgi:hypothetical protein
MEEPKNKWEDKDYRNTYFRKYYIEKTGLKNKCECGGVYTLNQKVRHQQTTKHKNYTQFNGLTKDELIHLLNQKSA